MKIGIIGCGAMGTAFARGWAQQYQLLLYDRNVDKKERLAKELGKQAGGSLKQVMQEADIILLAIKPKDLDTLIIESRGLIRGKKIISLLTGVLLSRLQKSFPDAQVMRIMPNLGVVVGKGLIAAIESSHFPKDDKEKIEVLFQKLGEVIWLSEQAIDPFIALSGSGIAFFFLILEGMIDGGVYLGVNGKLAKEILIKTMEGAAALVEKTGKHPAELRSEVSSPGGTTIEGIYALEEGKIRATLFAGLKACHEKAIRITKEVEKKSEGSG